ncbi:MAG: VWA domain-containing protein [Pyrinomonadaceae bacterium]
MKIYLSVLAFFVLMAVGSGVFAQSRRVPPARSNDKSNQRDRRAEPMPTPTPEADKITEESGEVISIDTRLVAVPVRVLDRKNRFIGGLTQENFTIFEDGVQQEIGYFTNESQPFTVALVLDMSYSATFKIDQIQNAAIAFIAQLRPEDKVMVISFDEEVHMLCEATSDRKRIYAAIRSTRIATGTSLYEAVDLTMNERMRSIEGRKAIVLFTDGVDTTSRRSHDAANIRDAMELDALIYPIRYDTYADVQSMKNRIPVSLPPGIPLPDSGTRLPPGSPGNLPIPIPTSTRSDRPRTPRNDPRTFPDDDRQRSPTRPPIVMPGQRGTTAEEYRFAEEYLERLAENTGGRVHFATTFGNLNAAFARIASELREFYSIGYYPQAEGVPGTMRKIKVKVDRKDIAVRARGGYAVAKK